MEWHTSASDAFRALLVTPLQPYVQVELKSWDGITFPVAHVPNINWTAPLIFCQFWPPTELLNNPRARLVWLPMWDMMSNLPQEWWNGLPKSLRVVAFSEKIYQRARTAGLPTLRLHYYKEVVGCAPVQWQSGRILFYWNRTGLIGPRFLEQLCHALRVDKLLFRGQLDPKIPDQLAYTLPSRLGKTVVEELPTFASQAEYLAKIQQANIYIAPRATEGVGMTFIEALARGCAVFAFDAPTMNEYIAHNKTGYLFRQRQNNLITRLDQWRQRRLKQGKPTAKVPVSFAVTGSQNWSEIRRSDLLALGQSARQSHEIGYEIWRRHLSDYAAFVLEW